MKSMFRNSVLLLICCLFLGLNNVLSQSTPKKSKVQKVTTTFKVYGNCQMCKQTIEASLRRDDGVLKKNWNMDTQMMKVTYDKNKISLEQIKQKIADVGYDNDYAKANDDVYNNLRGCCKYERPKQ